MRKGSSSVDPACRQNGKAARTAGPCGAGSLSDSSPSQLSWGKCRSCPLWLFSGPFHPSRGKADAFKIVWLPSLKPATWRGEGAVPKHRGFVSCCKLLVIPHPAASDTYPGLPGRLTSHLMATFRGVKTPAPQFCGLTNVLPHTPFASHCCT